MSCLWNPKPKGQVIKCLNKFKCPGLNPNLLSIQIVQIYQLKNNLISLAPSQYLCPHWRKARWQMQHSSKQIEWVKTMKHSKGDQNIVENIWNKEWMEQIEDDGVDFYPHISFFLDSSISPISYKGKRTVVHSLNLGMSTRS